MGQWPSCGECHPLDVETGTAAYAGAGVRCSDQAAVSQQTGDHHGECGPRGTGLGSDVRADWLHTHMRTHPDRQTAQLNSLKWLIFLGILNKTNGTRLKRLPQLQSIRKVF